MAESTAVLEHCRQTMLKIIVLVLLVLGLLSLGFLGGVKWNRQTPIPVAGSPGAGAVPSGDETGDSRSVESPESKAFAKSPKGQGKRTNAGSLRPFLQVQRITRFGQSLQLTGKVDAGCTLKINDETANVTGTGEFKHFTKPFVWDVQQAELVFTVTNLAGKSTVFVTYYDFDGENSDR